MNTHRLKTTYMHACRFMFIRVQICTGAANAAPRQLLRQVIGRARSQARAQYVHVHTIRVRVCVLCVFTRVQVIGYNQRVNMYFDTYIEVCTCAHPLSRARTELGFRESWTGWNPPSPRFPKPQLSPCAVCICMYDSTMRASIFVKYANPKHHYLCISMYAYAHKQTFT